ncbi:MAG: DMT family transporter, partial [Eubacterium sp.]|nr:DMT family transporter [Eubacterium sp.]
LLSASVVLIPYLLVTEDMSAVQMSSETIVLVLIVGIVHTGLAYLLYFGSMRGIRAQTIALLSYIDPVTALILSAVILHESLSLSGAVGAVMILGAALLSEVEFKK